MTLFFAFFVPQRRVREAAMDRPRISSRDGLVRAKQDEQQQHHQHQRAEEGLASGGRGPATGADTPHRRGPPIPNARQSFSSASSGTSPLTPQTPVRSLAELIQSSVVGASSSPLQHQLQSSGSSATLPTRTRRKLVQDRSSLGIYNCDLPSPRPNVLLPNFSISPYAEDSRRSPTMDLYR